MFSLVTCDRREAEQRVLKGCRHSRSAAASKDWRLLQSFQPMQRWLRGMWIDQQAKPYPASSHGVIELQPHLPSRIGANSSNLAGHHEGSKRAMVRLHARAHRHSLYKLLQQAIDLIVEGLKRELRLEGLSKEHSLLATRYTLRKGVKGLMTDFALITKHVLRVTKTLLVADSGTEQIADLCLEYR